MNLYVVASPNWLPIKTISTNRAHLLLQLLSNCESLCFPQVKAQEARVRSGKYVGFEAEGMCGHYSICVISLSLSLSHHKRTLVCLTAFLLLLTVCFTDLSIKIY